MPNQRISITYLGPDTVCGTPPPIASTQTPTPTSTATPTASHLEVDTDAYPDGNDNGDRHTVSHSH
jgi:hypothetical protein